MAISHLDTENKIRRGEGWGPFGLLMLVIYGVLFYLLLK